MRAPYFQDSHTTVYQGDAREVLRTLPERSVQTCVTSPPYWGLRDYKLRASVWDNNIGCSAKRSVGGGLISDAHEWGETIPSRRPEGNDWQSFDDYNTDGKPRVGRGKESQGGGEHGAFCRLCGAWRGTLGLEPTPELYVEHMVQVFREVRRVLRDDGTVWLNLGDSYAGSGKGQNGNGEHAAKHGEKQHTNAGTLSGGLPTGWAGLKPKDLVGIPWRVAFALQADGWWLRSDIVWAKPNPMPESVRDRPTRSHEMVFLLTKRARYYWDGDAIREPAFYGPSRPRDGIAPQDHKLESNGTFRGGSRANDGDPSAGRNKRSVWEIATQPYPDAHFATFPEALVRPCILAGTSERGACAECGAPWERVTEASTDYADFKAAETERRGSGIRSNDLETLGLTRGTSNKSITADYRTTGWRPTCKHGSYRCLYCANEVEYSKRDGSQGLAQTPSSNDHLQAMRGAVGAPGVAGSQQTEAVLQSGLHGPLGSEDKADDEGLGSDSEGIHSTVPAEPSNGDEDRLRLGASGSSSGDVGQDAGGSRSRQPSQQREGRQPPGEPRGFDEEGPRCDVEQGPSTQGSLSRMRGSLQPARTCGQCGHDLVFEPAPTVPCVVLDPFAGSGTTALVARKAGRKAILIELSEEYCRLIVDRIGQGVLL